MKIEFNALSQKIYIEPYKTYQEKDLMLIPSYTDGNYKDETLDIALDILKIPENIINSLSLNEKKALIYKFREISVGDTLEIKYKCRHCNMPSTGEINIANIIKKPIKHSKHIIDLHRLPIDEIDFRNNFIKNINDLDYEEYENIYLNIKDYLTYYDFSVKVKCFSCKKENILSIYNNKFIFDCISDDSIESLYKNYHALIYYGHWNKTDIDNLYPFERQIYIQLLNKTIEENNKRLRN